MAPVFCYPDALIAEAATPYKVSKITKILNIIQALCIWTDIDSMFVNTPMIMSSKRNKITFYNIATTTEMYMHIL